MSEDITEEMVKNLPRMTNEQRDAMYAIPIGFTRPHPTLESKNQYWDGTIWQDFDFTNMKGEVENGILIKRTLPCVKCGKDNYLEEVLNGNYFTIVNHNNNNNENHEYVCFNCFINNNINNLLSGSPEEQETLKSILMLKMKNIKIDHIVHIFRMLEEDPILYDLMKGRFGLDE